MANFTTTYDLKAGALRRAGELADTQGSSPYDSLALTYLNQIYQAIISGGNEFELELGEPWSWAKAKNAATLILNAPYNTGTVAMTAGLTSGTFSSGPAASQVGKFIKIDNVSEYFRIVSHTAAATAFTIDAAYTGSTGSGLTYNAYELEYDLNSGIERIIGPMRVYRNQVEGLNQQGEIQGADLNWMMNDYPLTELQQGTPSYFAYTYRDQSGLVRVRFNRTVGTSTKVDYMYIPQPNPLVTASFLDADVNTGTETITISSPHRLVNGDIVYFETSGVLPTGLSKETPYYVIGATSTTFQVSLTSGGTAVNITAASGGGTHLVTNMPIMPQHFRSILEYGAAYYICVDKNDDRAQTYFALAKSKMQAMIQASRRESAQTRVLDYGRIIPRLDAMPTGKNWRT